MPKNELQLSQARRRSLWLARFEAAAALTMSAQGDLLDEATNIYNVSFNILIGQFGYTASQLTKIALAKTAIYEVQS